MRLNQNAKIRLNIMMIAILGCIFFLVFLGGSYWGAIKSEHRIEKLQHVEFPIIQNLIQLKEDVDRIRESLSSAILLESRFLIEESLELAPEFIARLDRITILVASKEPELVEIRAYFDAYTGLAQKLAQILVEDPNNIAHHEEAAARTHEAFNLLNDAISRYLSIRQTVYAEGLEQISHDLEQTHKAGALFGLIIVVSLFALSWLITKNVMVAIHKADKLKESFLTTISHELRTPINGVVGALSLLRRNQLEEGQRELVDIAMTSSSTMIKTVDDILTFADLMGGKPRLNLTCFSVADLVGDLLKVARRTCEEKHLQFEVLIQGDEFQLVSDKSKLLNLVRHLLDNAIKYSASGLIHFRLTLAMEDSATSKGSLTLEIIDSGPGIKAVDPEELFKPFYQLDGSFKRFHQGMGIGLAMSRSIASLLHGRLTLTNNASGTGTTALFVCPVELAKAPIRAPVQNPLPEGSETSAVDHGKSALAEAAELIVKRDKPPCIMIVEDNKVNQLVLSKLVKQLQCEALLASNGEEAVKMLQDHSVDLVLMDCQMPVMDGFEATEAIRSLQSAKASVPIIAVTANARDADRERCFDVGMNGFLGKPVDFRSVRQVLDQFLV